MDVLVSLAIGTALFIISAMNGIDLLFPLFTICIMFFWLSIRKGVTVRQSLYNGLKGGRKSLAMVKVFMLIGAIVSLWMISGTVPTIVYYGMQMIQPNLFILSAFLLSAIVSMLMGTSFGTVGTIGVALMVMAKAGGGNIYAVAGAILSGCCLGDRTSPMSSSANLVANLTDTQVYDNVKAMLKSSVLPVVITVVLYGGLSMLYPVSYTGSAISSQLKSTFTIHWSLLLPAVVIFALAMMRVQVKWSMLASICVAMFLAFTIQHQSVGNISETIMVGFYLPTDHPLYWIIRGGGILSMFRLSVIVFLSSMLTGLIEGANMLEFMEKPLEELHSPTKTFLATIATSIITSMVGCTQVLAVMLTKMTMEKTYRRMGCSNKMLALHLEDSAIVLCALIPWNIAALVPMTTLGVGMESLGFAFYVMLLPIVNLFIIYRNNHKPRALKGYHTTAHRAA